MNKVKLNQVKEMEKMLLDPMEIKVITLKNSNFYIYYLLDIGSCICDFVQN